MRGLRVVSPQLSSTDFDDSSCKGREQTRPRRPSLSTPSHSALARLVLANGEGLIRPALGLRISIGGLLNHGLEVAGPLILVANPVPLLPAIVVHDQRRLKLLTLIDFVKAHHIPSESPRDASRRWPTRPIVTTVLQAMLSYAPC